MHVHISFIRQIIQNSLTAPTLYHLFDYVWHVHLYTCVMLKKHLKRGKKKKRMNSQMKTANAHSTKLSMILIYS